MNRKILLGSEIPTGSHAHEANCPQTRCIQSHRNGLVIALVLGARRAEVAAPPVVEVLKVRDALTSYRSLARLFAFPNARHFLRRALEVFLPSTYVALDVGAYLHP